MLKFDLGILEKKEVDTLVKNEYDLYLEKELRKVKVRIDDAMATLKNNMLSTLKREKSYEQVGLYVEVDLRGFSDKIKEIACSQLSEAGWSYVFSNEMPGILIIKPY